MFMKQLLFSLIFASFISDAVAQTIVSADLERRKTRSGIMILYFGNNRIIQQWTFYDIENETNQTNEWQGKFRYAPFSFRLMEHSIGTDRCYNSHLKVSRRNVITCMDQFDKRIPIYKNDHGNFTLDKDEFQTWFNPMPTYFSCSPDLTEFSIR